MNKDQDMARLPHQWNAQSPPSALATSPDSDPARSQRNRYQSPNQPNSPYSAPPSSPSRLPDRVNVPTRSSSGPSDPVDRTHPAHDFVPHARSEDLSHTYSSSSALSGSSPRPSPAFLSSSGSRPSTPASSSKHNHPSSSGHSDDSSRRMSVASFSSAHSGSSNSNSSAQAPPPSSSTSASLSTA